MRPRRRERRRDHHSNHFQRLHEHSSRGAERADPGECACNGGGWILSSCDVYEKCHRHYDGQPHPEHRISSERKAEMHEIYVQKCREERIDDPAEAHREALEEKQRREEESGDRPWWIGGSDDPDETGENGPELPF